MGTDSFRLFVGQLLEEAFHISQGLGHLISKPEIPNIHQVECDRVRSGGSSSSSSIVVVVVVVVVAVVVVVVVQ